MTGTTLQVRLKPWFRDAMVVQAAIEAGALDTAGKLCRALPRNGPQAQAWALELEGEIALARDDLSNAQALFLRAAAIAENHASACCDAEQGARVHRLAALAYRHVGDIARTLGMTKRPAEVAGVGKVFIVARNIMPAIRCYQEAFRLATSYGTVSERWELAAAIADTFHSGRDDAQALQWGLRALEEAERLEAGSDEQLATSWRAIARALARLGRMDEARPALENARSFAERAGLPPGFSTSAVEEMAETTASNALTIPREPEGR